MPLTKFIRGFLVAPVKRKLEVPTKVAPAFGSWPPNAKPYPNTKNPTHAVLVSRMFFSSKFDAFFRLTQPAESMANPSCIRKTIVAEMTKSQVRTLSAFMLALSSIALAIQTRSTDPVAFKHPLNMVLP